MGSRPTVLVLDIFPDTEIEEHVLGDLAEVVRMDPAGPRADIAQRASTAVAILVGLLPVDRELIGQLRCCQVIARYGTGTDSVDLVAAREAGIPVTNVPDFAVEEVSIHTLMLALAALRRLPEATAQVTTGSWDLRTLGRIRRVSTMCFGVVGLGRIGRRVCELARAVGFDVVGTSMEEIAGTAHGIRLADLDGLLAQADVVSLHVPLDPSTRHLMDARRIAAMKPGAVLINTARGGLVDTRALCTALRAGQLSGAALDTFEGESSTGADLTGTPGLILTPHMGFFSDAAVAEMRQKAARQVRHVLEGRPAEYFVRG